MNGNTTAEQIAIVELNPWVMVTIYRKEDSYSSNNQWVLVAMTETTRRDHFLFFDWKTIIIM